MRERLQMSKGETKSTSFRLPKEIKDKLERLAKQNNATQTKILLKLIDKADSEN